MKQPAVKEADNDNVEMEESKDNNIIKAKLKNGNAGNREPLEKK